MKIINKKILVFLNKYHKLILQIKLQRKIYIKQKNYGNKNSPIQKKKQYYLEIKLKKKIILSKNMQFKTIKKMKKQNLYNKNKIPIKKKQKHYNYKSKLQENKNLNLKKNQNQKIEKNKIQKKAGKHQNNQTMKYVQKYNKYVHLKLKNNLHNYLQNLKKLPPKKQIMHQVQPTLKQNIRHKKEFLQIESLLIDQQAKIILIEKSQILINNNPIIYKLKIQMIQIYTLAVKEVNQGIKLKEKIVQEIMLTVFMLQILNHQILQVKKDLLNQAGQFQNYPKIKLNNIQQIIIVLQAALIEKLNKLIQLKDKEVPLLILENLLKKDKKKRNQILEISFKQQIIIIVVQILVLYKHKIKNNQNKYSKSGNHNLKRIQMITVYQKYMLSLRTIIFQIIQMNKNYMIKYSKWKEKQQNQKENIKNQFLSHKMKIMRKMPNKLEINNKKQQTCYKKGNSNILFLKKSKKKQYNFHVYNNNKNHNNHNLYLHNNLQIIDIQIIIIICNQLIENYNIKQKYKIVTIFIHLQSLFNQKYFFFLFFLFLLQFRLIILLNIIINVYFIIQIQFIFYNIFRFLLILNLLQLLFNFLLLLKFFLQVFFYFLFFYFLFFFQQLFIFKFFFFQLLFQIFFQIGIFMLLYLFIIHIIFFKNRLLLLQLLLINLLLYILQLILLLLNNIIIKIILILYINLLIILLLLQILFNHLELINLTLFRIIKIQIIFIIIIILIKILCILLLLQKLLLSLTKLIIYIIIFIINYLKISNLTLLKLI